LLAPSTTLILIGLRGSGKTTIARLLGARLNRPAVDLDDLTPTYLREKTAGDALRVHGEPAFRRAELAALQDALKTPGTILALGGGTPTAPGVAEMLEGAKKQGLAHIIYLRATEPTLRARLLPRPGGGGAGGSATAEGEVRHASPTPESARPSLTGKGTLEEIGVLLNLRDTLYKTLASSVIDVNTKTQAEIVDLIAASL
jgi:shikimate kinase